MPAPSAETAATVIPALSWNQELEWWDGLVSLPEWEAFNQGTGAWKAIRTATLGRRRRREKAAGQLSQHFPPSTDPLALTVVPARDEAPTPAQVQAYQWLLVHESELLGAVLAAIEANWDELGLIYSYDDESATRHSFPATLRAPEELCGLLELHHVYLSRHHEQGLTHIGLALSCAWDPEHGFGVLVCQGEVRGLGSSDLASGGDIDEAFIDCAPAS